MSEQHIPTLRRRFSEDMRIKGLQPTTQTMYLRAMRDFTGFPGHSPDSATPEEVRAFQLDMKEKGVGAPTFNNRLVCAACRHTLGRSAPQAMKPQRLIPIAPRPARAFLLARFVAAAAHPDSSRQPKTLDRAVRIEWPSLWAFLGIPNRVQIAQWMKSTALKGDPV